MIIKTYIPVKATLSYEEVSSVVKHPNCINALVTEWLLKHTPVKATSSYEEVSSVVKTP